MVSWLYVVQALIYSILGNPQNRPQILRYKTLSLFLSLFLSPLHVCVSPCVCLSWCVSLLSVCPSVCLRLWMHNPGLLFSLIKFFYLQSFSDLCRQGIVYHIFAFCVVSHAGWTLVFLITPNSDMGLVTGWEHSLKSSSGGDMIFDNVSSHCWSYWADVQLLGFMVKILSYFILSFQIWIILPITHRVRQSAWQVSQFYLTGFGNQL